MKMKHWAKALLALLLILTMLPVTVLGEETAEEQPAAQTEEKTVTVTAVGATLQEIDEDDKNVGTPQTTLIFTGKGAFKVIPDVKRNIRGYAINGVLYNFMKTVKTITVKNLTWDMTIEPVYKGAYGQTQKTVEQVVDTATGEQLTVKSINARMCHLKTATKGAGGWFTEFDFTKDYTNNATKQLEPGGQVTVKVSAQIPKKKKVRAWKFNDAEFTFDARVTDFVVNLLDTSMVYEPLFGAAPVKEGMVTIKCGRNCHFSGGGKSGKSGTLPKGTKVTLYWEQGHIGTWTINGSTRRHSGNLTITLNKNTTVSYDFDVN